MPNSYRIRTQVGVDKSVKVLLEQDFEYLELLSLKLLKSQIYQRKCSDYGVIVGRVTANNGFGIPNVKVSVFVPLTNQDSLNPIISDLYPYKSINDLNEDGYRYNLLPYTKSHSGHIPVGTFFSKEDVLTNPNYIEVFDKYYKYTALTNDSGDYMIFGVPNGDQIVHIDIDLSDIGEFSLSPQDLIRMGIATESQVAGNKFRRSTNLNELVQLITFNSTLNVNPLWGDKDACTIAITRLDFDLTAQSNINITPTAIFMGSLFSSNDDQFQKRNCKPKINQGELCNLVAGPGEILTIRHTPEVDDLGRPILEVFDLEQGGQVIDDNGTWLVDLPMNLDYVVTNEFGERIVSNDPTKGIPTKAKYRFKIKWNQSPKLSQPIKRGYFLVPNVREYGWTDSDEDPLVDFISGSSEYNLAMKSYAFSLNWEEYADIQAAIDCEDTFYPFLYNKVYTVSQLIDQYRNGLLPNRIIAIRNILDSTCESTNVKFPTNDAVLRFDLIYLLFVIMMFIFKPILYIILLLTHFVAGILKEFGNPNWRRLANIPLPNLTYPECDLCECTVGKPVRGNGPTDFELNVAQTLDSNAYISSFNIFTKYNCFTNFGTQQLLAGNQDYGTQNPYAQAPQLEAYTRFPNQNRETFTTSIPLFERINLFNTKAKYFNDGFNNPGGSWNRIGVTFRPSLNGTNNQTATYAQQYQNVVVNTGLYPINIFPGSPQYFLFPVPFSNQTVFPSIGPNPYNMASSQYIAPIAGLYEVTLNITCTNYIGFPEYSIGITSNNSGGNFDFSVNIDNVNVSNYTVNHIFSLNANDYIRVIGGTGVIDTFSFDSVITMTVTAISTPPSSLHMDICNFLVVKPEKASSLTAGTILSFQDPTLSKDPNLTGATLNQFGNNAIIGTSINNGASNSPAQITVTWAKPDGTGNNQTIYNIIQEETDAQYAKYPMDIEYFQVITAITINQFFQLCEAEPTSLGNYRNANAASLRYRIFKSGIVRNVINTNNLSSVGWDERIPPSQVFYENCFEDYGEQVIVFMVRGVDPYSSRGEVEYDLSRLFGYGLNTNGTPTGQVKVKGNNYKLNIPIQGHYGCVRHNYLTSDVTSIDPIMAQGIYYPSYHFQPNISQFTGFTSDLPSYYSSLSAEYGDTTNPLRNYLSGAASVSDGSEPGAAGAGQLGFMPASYKYLKLKPVVINVYNNDIRYVNTNNGFIIVFDTSNQTFATPRRYGYLYNNTTSFGRNQGFIPNEVVDGGSYMLQFLTIQNQRANQDFMRATGYHYSPRYNNQQYNYNNCATTHRIVMRSDRLPTSTNLLNNLENSFAFQANNLFTVFEIFDDGTFAFSSGEPVISPTFGDPNQTIDNFGTGNTVLNTFNCASMVPLECYYVPTINGRPSNEIAVQNKPNNCYENGVDGTEILQDGCYVVVTAPFNSLGKDFKILNEWASRLQITFGACRNVVSHIFTNNWINGTLYAFAFKNDRFFTSPSTIPIQNANKPYSEYCKDTIVLHPTNNFYYRSSPYKSGTTTSVPAFIGANRPNTEPILQFFNVNNYGGNRFNLKFPTTIIDMGPRSQYLQELVFSDAYDGFIMNRLSETTYKDVSDILNYFIVSRFTNKKQQEKLISGANIEIFFKERDKNFIDADYAQMISISSEIAINEFEAINYPPLIDRQDPLFFNSPSSTDPVMGIYFSSDTQTRDFITPKRTILSNTLSIGQVCGFNYYDNFSQIVPFYQWQIVENKTNDSIFGSRRNNWYTSKLQINPIPNQRAFFNQRYQNLDRLNNLSRYYRPQSSSYSKDFKGYIYDVKYTAATPYDFEYKTSWGPPTPANNPEVRIFQVGAPYHFYFGLKKGKTAWDRFAKKWLDLEAFTD
jgi:hypothetical protein